MLKLTVLEIVMEIYFEWIKILLWAKQTTSVVGSKFQQVQISKEHVISGEETSCSHFKEQVIMHLFIIWNVILFVWLRLNKYLFFLLNHVYISRSCERKWLPKIYFNNHFFFLLIAYNILYCLKIIFEYSSVVRDKNAIHSQFPLSFTFFFFGGSRAVYRVA